MSRRAPTSRFTLSVERTLASMERQVRDFYHEESRAQYAARLRFSALIGMIFVSFFFGLDLITWLMIHEDFPIIALGLVRVLSIVVFWAMGRALAARPYAPRTLLVLDLAIFASVGVFEGALCLWVDGIGSNYYAGIMLLMMVRGMLVPTSMRRTIGVMLAAWGMWVGILFVAALVHQGTADQFANRHELGMFLSNNFFTLTGFGVAVVSAAVMYSLRRSAAQARQIGRYRLIRCLGRGGMGEVYLAEIGVLRRPCAVKIIGRSMPVSEVARKRFQHEALETSRLAHPNTIGIFDFGETDDGVLYYAMEYLDGLDLGELLRIEGRVPPARAVHFAMQACASLGDAHQKRIVHRDIKPENLLVTGPSAEPDFLKVLDFGLAKALGTDGGATVDMTGAHAVIGTPLYMSPEACEGGRIDARSDVYSLGAVLYHLLTGSVVHAGTTATSIMVAHMTMPAEPPSSRAPGAAIPHDLEEIVMKAIARAPEQRFPSMEALRAALSGCSVASAWTREHAEAWWVERDTKVRAVHARRAEQTSGALTFFDRAVGSAAEEPPPGAVSLDPVIPEHTPYSDTMAAPLAGQARVDDAISTALSDLYQAGWLLDVAALRARRPQHILFVCDDNAAVSQMAEAIGRSLAPPGVVVSSAGLAPAPVSEPAIAALREAGVAVDAPVAKPLAALDLSTVDTVVLLTPNRPSDPLPPHAQRLSWPMPPIRGGGPDVHRAVRDELTHRLRVLFA
ncbi:MAG: hypothetical protein AMXMBFR64_21930 [Myxococcales bacterium]